MLHVAVGLVFKLVSSNKICFKEFKAIYGLACRLELEVQVVSKEQDSLSGMQLQASLCLLDKEEASGSRLVGEVTAEAVSGDHWVSVDTTAKANFKDAWYGGVVRVRSKPCCISCSCLKVRTPGCLVLRLIGYDAGAGIVTKIILASHMFFQSCTSKTLRCCMAQHLADLILPVCSLT